MLEAFNLFFRPEIERRQQAWLEQLRVAVRELEGRLDAQAFENLRHDPAFYSAVAHATEVAKRTHREEKLWMLRNAVVNSGLRSAPSDDVRQVFLRLVDDLTPVEVRLLLLFHVYPGFRGRTSSVMQHPTMEEAFLSIAPELGAHKGLLRWMAERLAREGLVEDSVFEGRDAGNGVSLRWLDLRRPDPGSFTTPLGKDFVRFISEPPG
ncbi:MAG: hypothetical protein QOE90_3317 [Thermoplasmata archaeon]|jgi:hypothetical protein|nr:hypothetical protein [Thermoplasmata archaeon]